MSEPRRWATLVATAGVLRVSAVDDAPDLFSVLIAAKLIGPAARAKAKDRMRSLPQLRRASVTLAAAAKAMLGCAEGSCDLPRTCSPPRPNCAAGTRGDSMEVYLWWPCQRAVPPANKHKNLLEIRAADSVVGSRLEEVVPADVPGHAQLPVAELLQYMDKGGIRLSWISSARGRGLR